MSSITPYIAPLLVFGPGEVGHLFIGEALDFKRRGEAGFALLVEQT